MKSTEQTTPPASIMDTGTTDPTSENALALRAAADTKRLSRCGLLVLILGLGGFLLWAALAPLDEGVPTPGVVTIDTKRKTIQHLTGGIVKEVLVREGEQVREGQVLLRLDDAVARANFEVARQRYLGLSAVQSRLLAEQSGNASLTFERDLLEAASTDSSVAMLLNNQRQLFGTRRAGLQSDIQGLREAIESAKTQGETARLMAQQRQRQLDLLREELSNIRELVSDGYVPRNRQLELERMSADIQASIAELTGNAIRAERTIAELTQRIQSRNAEYRKDVESQLADIAREVQADAKKYLAEKASLQRTELRSPTSGQVVGLMVQTIGAVIQPGEKLMDVVPDKQRLLLETKVPPHLIDKVHADLLADIRFNTFAHSPQLVIPGRVLSVSGDLMVDPQNPQFGYFLARIEVTPDGIQALGNRQLQPGMPVEVLIRTGERSLLQYLLHPLTKRIASAMKEE